VEDQPADSGDLTTGAESPAQPAGAADSDEATDDKAARRRMPLRKDLASSADDAVDTAAEVQTETVDGPTSLRRRWALFRRRTKAPEPQAEPEESKPAPRTPVGKAARAAKPVAEPEPNADEQAADEDPEVQEEQEEQILVPHRPAGKRLRIAAVAAGVLFIAAAAFAGATLQPYLADRALVHTKLDIARTAANAITTLWTYTPDNMDKLPDRSAGYLGGDFANEYRKYIDAIVAPNKQAQVTNTTQVMGTAVESVTPTEATALVYTNSVATSPASKGIPSLRYLSYRLTMEHRDAKWLITRMSTVTSFDLTPQL
jgi:Mce-associated membrane protein